ncbi:MAG: VRR-NUC domain-containing protein [Lachnospiraceae bacterium]|nr:VRR-NUC domain-containing protein [Lachnospiraceae bacterium]
MPDRIIMLPGSRVLWVELKTKGGKLSEIQKLRHAELAKLGQDVVVVWNKEQVDELVAELCAS